ncbi:MAG: ribosome maturation factor RimM, partial [Parasphingopyxis sp.]
MAEKRVTLAVVAGAHGVGGEVRLKLFTADLSNFSSYRRYHCGDRTLTLVKAREGTRGALAKFEEIADRNAAEALRGAEL